MLSNWLLGNQDSILREVLYHIERNQFRFQVLSKRFIEIKPDGHRSNVLKPVKVEPGVLYELMETVAYNDITEDSKRWVFARPYNADAAPLKLEEIKARVINYDLYNISYIIIYKIYFDMVSTYLQTLFKGIVFPKK